MTDPVVLRNCLTALPDGDFRTTSLAISGGRIVGIGEASVRSMLPTAETIDCSDYIVIPGMANAHCHSNENWFRGYWDQLPLELWSAYAYPKLGAPAQSGDEIFVRTLIGALEMLRTGATTVVDFLLDPHGIDAGVMDAVVRAYRAVGMRAIIAMGISDLPYQETVVIDEKLIETPLLQGLTQANKVPWRDRELFIRDMVRRYHSPATGISIALAPSGPQRCSDELLTGCAKLASELDLVLHLHVLETRMQALSGARRYGTTIPAHLARLGILSPRVSFAHGIWMTRHDVEITAESGVTVVHNPLANLKLGSGLSDVPAMLRAGINVALGTDGVSSNDGNDMFAVLKMATLLGRLWESDYLQWPSAQDLWSAATIGGARSAGLAGLTGAIKVGWAADLVFLDRRNVNFTPLTYPLRQIVFGSSAPAVRAAMVDGKWIMRDGEFKTINESDVLSEARRMGADVIARHAPAHEIGEKLLPGLRSGWLEAAAAADKSSMHLLHDHLGLVRNKDNSTSHSLSPEELT